MTGGLVSIPELRARAEAAGSDWGRSVGASPASGAEVLALVEAVEAAQKALPNSPRSDTTRERKLRDALAKFSFEAAAGASEQ